MDLYVNEEDAEMTILLMVSRSVFFIAVVLYIYLFSQRKKKSVIVQMWLTVVVGMLAALSGQLIEVNLGKTSWASIQINFYLYLALVIYSLWRLTKELKKRQ